jgi:hypothetical protein
MLRENDDDGWSSDGVMFWLERKQNKEMVKWWGQ